HSIFQYLEEVSDYPLAVCYFNATGKLYLALAILNGNVAVLLGNGDGSLQTPVKYAAGSRPAFVAVGDFNGDGKPDFAVANVFSVGTVSVLLNTCVSAGIELAILRSNSTVKVSWPLPSAGFVLESTTSLSLTNWQRAVETTTTNNARLEVLLPADQQQRYFRLHKP